MTSLTFGKDLHTYLPLICLQHHATPLSDSGSFCPLTANVKQTFAQDAPSEHPSSADRRSPTCGAMCSTDDDDDDSVHIAINLTACAQSIITAVALMSAKARC